MNNGMSYTCMKMPIYNVDLELFIMPDASMVEFSSLEIYARFLLF